MLVTALVLSPLALVIFIIGAIIIIRANRLAEAAADEQA